MIKITRYIAKTVLLSIAVVALVLVGIYVIFAFVGESGDIGHGGYGALNAMIFVLLSVPSNLSFILPAAALIGTLVGLGQMASNSELIAIRASGVSIVKIASAVMLAGCVMMGVSFFLSSYLGPLCSQAAMIAQISAKDNRAFLLTPQATWLKEGDDFIYIGKSNASNQLSNVSKYDFKDGRLSAVLHADKAVYQRDQWQLTGVDVTHISQTHIQLEHKAQMVWPQLISPSLLSVVSSRVGNLNIVKLLEYISYREHNGLSTQKYALSFWQIIFEPFSVLILMLMAVPFVFGPLRSSTVGMRLVFGVIFGFVFFVLDRFFGPFSLVLGWPPMLGAIVPSLIFFVIMSVSLWRMN